MNNTRSTPISIQSVLLPGLVDTLADQWCVPLRPQRFLALARGMQMTAITCLVQELREASIDACNHPRLSNRHLLTDKKLRGQAIHTTVEA